MLEDGAGTIHRVREETDFGSLQEDARFKWHLLCANHFCGSFTLGDSLSYLFYFKDPSSTTVEKLAVRLTEVNKLASGLCLQAGERDMCSKSHFL